MNFNEKVNKFLKNECHLVDKWFAGKRISKVSLYFTVDNPVEKRETIIKKIVKSKLFDCVDFSNNIQLKTDSNGKSYVWGGMCAIDVVPKGNPDNVRDWFGSYRVEK